MTSKCDAHQQFIGAVDERAAARLAFVPARFGLDPLGFASIVIVQRRHAPFDGLGDALLGDRFVENVFIERRWR